jgi:hypothetical protein
MSMIAIWITITAKLANTRVLRFSSAPSSVPWISVTLFASRNRPPNNRMMSRPENSNPNKPNQGFVRRVSQTIENSSAMRVTIANARPVMRAVSRRSGGRRLTRMEMKMMLSMPSTISRADSVRNAIHACGSVSSSIIGRTSSARAPRYGSWSMGSLRTTGNRCSALRPNDSAMALEM